MFKICMGFRLHLGLLAGVLSAQGQPGHGGGRTRVVIIGHESRERNRTWSIYEDGVHRIEAHSAEYFTVAGGRTLVVREMAVSYTGNPGRGVPVDLVLKQGSGELCLARATFRNRGDLPPLTVSRTFSPGIPVAPGGQVKVVAGPGEVMLYGFYAD